MTVTELAALHQAETADAPLFLKMLCYLVHERKLFACCWLKADYSFLLSKGAATSKLAVSFIPPVRKLNTRLDILLVRIFSAELLLDELKRLLFTNALEI